MLEQHSSSASQLSAPSLLAAASACSGKALCSRSAAPTPAALNITHMHRVGLPVDVEQDIELSIAPRQAVVPPRVTPPRPQVVVPPAPPRPDWNLRRGLSDLAPNEFICPISLSVMTDPVKVKQSGISYDRANIREWLREHPRTDPKTNIHYSTNLKYKSDKALLKEIREWQEQPETIEALEQRMSRGEERAVLPVGRVIAPAGERGASSTTSRQIEVGRAGTGASSHWEAGPRHRGPRRRGHL